jgi:hypothetical protein
MKIVSEREVMREKNTCFSLASDDPRIVALLQLLPPGNRTIQFAEFDILDALNKVLLLGTSQGFEPGRIQRNNMDVSAVCVVIRMKYRTVYFLKGK